MGCELVSPVTTSSCFGSDYFFLLFFVVGAAFGLLYLF
jgi:hypothetical protein